MTTINHSNQVTNIVLARYSTPDNSWISPYINAQVAAKHIKDNAKIHFADRWHESDETENCADIQLKLDQREGIIEIDDWSVEIEYDETIITE